MTDKVPTWKFPPRTVKQLLKRARKVLSKPERWTKGSYAKDEKGIVVFGSETRARCFCLLGALDRGGTEALSGGMWRKAHEALGYLEESGIARFNDDPKTTHTDILTLLDKAIEEEEASQ